MSWFQRLMPSRIRIEGGSRKKAVPEGLWSKCPSCDGVLYRPEVERNLLVCPKCGHHHRMGARQRLETFLDAPREELSPEVAPVDQLRFRDSKKYRDRITQAQRQTGEKDALIVMAGQVMGVPLVSAAFEFDFMGGSMGAVVGEKFVRAVDSAAERQVPLVCFAASGGARMQEALVSLMQMAKTAAALRRLREKRLPYVSVLTDPTMGGVSASLATLGDINIAEPGALIGFAGPRVIEQTVRETLPDGFQRSEFLLDHGAIDMIVDRREMRTRVSSLLSMMTQSVQGSGWSALTHHTETAATDDTSSAAQKG